MNSMEFPRNSSQDLEGERRSVLIERGKKILSGELIYGDTIYNDLQSAIKESQESGVDNSAFVEEAERIINEIPKAEIRNVLNNVEKHLREQDLSSAKSWHSELGTVIGHWNERGVLQPDELDDFQDKYNSLYQELYK